MTHEPPDRSVPYDIRPENVSLHGALGLYITVFSEMASLMRHSIHDFLSPAEEAFPRPNHLLDMMFANMTAKPLADSFYSMATEVGDLDSAEASIKNRLRRETQRHISFRNDLAHAEWAIGWDDAETGEPMPPTSMRIKSVEGIPRLKDMKVKTSDLYRAVAYLRVHQRQLRLLAGTCRARQRGVISRSLTEQLTLIQKDGQSWVSGPED